MPVDKSLLPVFLLTVLLLPSAVAAQAIAQQNVTALCTPKVLADTVVATAAQREAAGSIAQPPLTDQQNGFAWPDTPLGVIKTAGGYEFFGSDGAFHARQTWNGHVYGNNKYGSVTTTVGTLDNPLGSAPPIDVTIHPNPDPAVNPAYASYDYMGGGSVYQVPATQVGAGNLLMVYHAEVPTVSTQSFYAVLGMARSLDNGKNWTDLGEIVRVNQAYRTDLDGFDIGISSLTLSPDGKYFYVFFPDWRANGTTHWGSTVTSASIARALVASVVQAAFGVRPHAVRFEKFYAGWDLSQGLGGYSTDLNTTAPYGGTLTVAYNADLHRYQMLTNGGVVVYYSESPDGLHWSPLSLLHDFRNDPDQPSVYVTFVGMGTDPSVLGLQFYIFYTRYPGNGEGWPGATVHRFTVSCP